MSEPTTSLSAEFRRVFDQEYAYVCRSLRRMGVRPSDIPDVCQELFLTVHRRFADYDPSRPVRAWLFSFAVRFASNYRRLARNRSEVVGLEGIGRVGAGGEAAIEARDLVLRALDTLDFDRRVVLVMHDLDGFPAPEIATHLGIPVNTVYSRIRLARADFRTSVDSFQIKEAAT